MLGVLVNALAILAGGSVGLLAKKGIPEKITNAIMTAIALCVIYIGVTSDLVDRVARHRAGEGGRKFIAHLSC